MNDDKQILEPVRTEYTERSFPRDEDYGRAGLYVMRDGQWRDVDHDRKWEDADAR